MCIRDRSIHGKGYVYTQSCRWVLKIFLTDMSSKLCYLIGEQTGYLLTCMLTLYRIVESVQRACMHAPEAWEGGQPTSKSASQGLLFVFEFGCRHKRYTIAAWPPSILGRPSCNFCCCLHGFSKHIRGYIVFVVLSDECTRRRRRKRRSQP